MDHKFTNRLAEETSPYLLQHAHNPVNWYPWGDEALQLAKQLNKPILVSIGYAACHWCHVMEHESFEDEEVAALMNEFFVNIKVDREERPDIDHIYMDAVQAITGSGGWPLNVFLTPGKKPFFGGTYYPPVRAFNRISWKELITAIHNSYAEKQAEIELQADYLIEHLRKANNLHAGNNGAALSFEMLHEITENILKRADTVWGGFGKAPKFPQTFCIQYLLSYYYFTEDERALKHATLSLDKMLQGGIYDHVGGGFARYSTDAEWLAPHFEKMLYDNALLVTTLSEAYMLTKYERYADAVRETISFVERELLHNEGGFCSSLDADSEGVEGKFYTWSKNEVDTILGDESKLFCDVYNITEEGNWEHTNILWLPDTLEQKAKDHGFDEKYLKAKLNELKTRLLKVRSKRIKPLLDDKIILAWNALMILACCKAYNAFCDEGYLQLAEKNMRFLEVNLNLSKNEWKHTWKNKQAKHDAFLDDYACLIKAYIQLQEATGKTEYLNKASQLTEFVINNFSAEDDILFYYTPAFQTDVVIKKKETYDGAVPSGNSLMACNLAYLSVIYNKPEWNKRSFEMISLMKTALIHYPTTFGVWISALQNLVTGYEEIAIVGKDFTNGMKEMNSYFIPNKILQSAEKEDSSFELLTHKGESKNMNIYICKQYACNKPVNTVAEAANAIKLELNKKTLRNNIKKIQ